MKNRPARIGDVVDDWCSRCRLVMNHGVVGMVAGEIKKVRCHTCYFEHPYRRGSAGKTQDRKKREMKKLFDQVLKQQKPGTSAEHQHKAPVLGRKVRIARPEAREDHPHLHRKSDPPAATLPPPPKDRGKVASWRRAWEDRIKK